jgi:hypothetical protein
MNLNLLLSMALYPIFGSWPLFQFINPIYNRQDSLDGGSAHRNPLPTHRTAQTQNKHTQTSMLRVGFESANSAFERKKTIHVSDRLATVIGKKTYRLLYFLNNRHTSLKD